MSHLEETFALCWRAAGGQRPVREYRFCPGRRWRLDFAWPRKRVAVEVEGGVWAGGRHNRASGFLADADKYNTAAALGWVVLRVPGPALDDPDAVVALVRRVLRARRHTGLRAELRTRHRTELARDARERRGTDDSGRGVRAGGGVGDVALHARRRGRRAGLVAA